MDDVLEEIVVFTPEQIHAFVEATEDTNPIHQGPRPVVPGLLLGLAAKKEVDKKLPAQYCRELKIEFRKEVYAGAEITSAVSRVKGVYPLVTTADFRNGADLLARCTASYDAETPKREKPSGERHITNHTLWLSQKAATCVSLALGRTEPNYEWLAIGFLSRVLLVHGEKFVAAHAKKGRKPVYMKQEFTFSQIIAQLTEQELLAQASTRLNNESPRVVTRVELTAQGQPVYKCQTYIAFVNS